MRYLVFAGNIRQFYDWCYEYGFDPPFWVYISSAERIYGFNNTYLYLVGTYWERDCLNDVMEYCSCHNIKIVD